jgi:hypothetical protein
LLCSTHLDEGIACIQDRHTHVELVALQPKVLLKAIQPGIGDGVLVELVHEVHAEDDGHDEGVQTSDELSLLWRLCRARTELIHVDISFDGGTLLGDLDMLKRRLVD